MFKYSKTCASFFASLTIIGFASSVSAGDYMTGNMPYSVEINKTEVLRLSSAASAVVIGNPSIADVSVHAADTLFVVGRGYGETNLIVLDLNGNVIMDTDIQVFQKPTQNTVRVFNRSDRQSYSCAPNCQPSPIIGDEPAFLANYSSQERPIQSSEALASGNPNRSDVTFAEPNDGEFGQ